MPAYMKEQYGDKAHPLHSKFIELVKKGCPRSGCGEELYHRGGFLIGQVFCSDVHVCAHEFEFDGNGWKQNADGSVGQLNERFRDYEHTNAYKEEKKRKAEEKANRKSGVAA